MKKLYLSSFIFSLLICLVANSGELFVDVNNSTPMSPYSSWATAATNIQIAVDTASAGDTIWVTNGVYLLTEHITVDKSLIIKSVNGPAETIIDAQLYSRCLVLEADSVSISGVTLCNGFSPDWDYGGAAYSSSADSSLSNCVVLNNISWDHGGGIYFKGQRGVVENCIFRNNQSMFGSAGGAYVISATNCLFEGNAAAELAGGLLAVSAAGSTFRNNVADGNCGGGMIEEVFGCVFEGNSAESSGGLACIGAYGCLFVSNSASSSGGGVSGTITNCTVVGNQSVESGGGWAGGQARNCIISMNSPDDISTNGSSTILYSCAPSLVHGQFGNVTNDPAFVDAVNGDYRLSAISPCVDLGGNAYVGGSSDLDNNPRIYNSRIDMGAYEYQGAVTDTDGDGIGDFAETFYGTDLDNPDSDGDGFDDGWEISKGWNPNQYDSAVSSYIALNKSVFGYYTEESVGDLSMGEAMLSVSNGMASLQLQLMTSENLVNWTNVGGSVHWSVPVTNDKAYFRIHTDP